MSIDVLIPADASAATPLGRFAGGARAVPPHRPLVLANMVASVDGATAVDGESRGLSGPADREVFHHLRGLADVVLAGSGTMRADNYRPANPSDAVRRERVARGQHAVPGIAVVTRSLRLDDSAPLVSQAEVATVVITPEDADLRVPAGADHLAVGRGAVDLAGALGLLHERGARLVLCEGGPTLLGNLVAAGLVDELFLTLSPGLAAGDSSRLLSGPELVPMSPLRLRALARSGGMLFVRYDVGDAAGSTPLR